METQNLTISLPKALVKRVKVIAAQRDTSISQLVREALERLGREDEAYLEAHRQFLELANGGLRLGVDRVPFDRDSLHDRDALRDS